MFIDINSELEFGFGVITQMIRDRNIIAGSGKRGVKWDHAKLSNILLKINTKLDGTNSVVKVQ